MLTGAQCNGVCECSNELNSISDDKCKKIVLDTSTQNDNGCLFIYNQDSFECQDQNAEKIYQKFTNVCRRGSINYEHCLSNNFNDVTTDSLEQYSTGFESNCTSIGTQTSSVHDANVQTTQSLESLSETSSELTDKFNLCSHARMRNFINYSRLFGSTKASSIESSVKDESTQYCDSCSSEHKSCSLNYPKTCTCYTCCNFRQCCHDPFYPKDQLDHLHDDVFCRNRNFDSKTNRYKNDNFHYPAELRSCLKRPFPVNTAVCPQCSPFTHHVPLICNCYVDLKSNFYALKENSVQFKEKFDEVKKINEIKSSSSSNNFDITAQKNLLKNKSSFDNGECSLDILDEKERKKSNDVEMKVFRIIKKAKSFDGINLDIEQRKPLLSDLSANQEKQEINGSNESIREEEENVIDENEKLKGTDCPNGPCRCMHDLSPESIHKNCIQVRPSRTNPSNQTSPLKVITILLFASAFLITGSAIKDAYYQ